VEIGGFQLDGFSDSIPKLINEEGKEAGEISIVLCTDEELLTLNQTHLQHDYFTDILTFDYTIDPYISGDLYVSYDRIRENASAFSVSVDEELHRVVFHGVLHLLGYNDKTDGEKTQMSTKENYYLSKLFHVKH
jgi:rRNA maturation RNase YbeY